MKRELTSWSKQARIAMINMDISVSELAKRIGKSRQYTSAIIHGRIYAEPTMKVIDEVLNISDTDSSSTVG